MVNRVNTAYNILNKQDAPSTNQGFYGACGLNHNIYEVLYMYNTYCTYVHVEVFKTDTVVFK